MEQPSGLGSNFRQVLFKSLKLKNRKQSTLAKPVELEGKGLHTGIPCCLRLLPAQANNGIVFVRTDLPERPEVPASVEYVTATERGTVIKKGAASAATIEHFLGALYGLRVENLRVELDGPEIPILDGSAAPYVKAINQAGLRALEEPSPVYQITESFEYSEGDKRICVEPAQQLLVSFDIDYGHAHLNKQAASLVITPESFSQWIAPARTFCFEFEIEAMRKAGLAKGGDLHCALVVGEGGLLNPPLRFSDEFVRHKILDFLGDLSLLGLPVLGHFTLHKSGHTFNVKAVKRMLGLPEQTLSTV